MEQTIFRVSSQCPNTGRPHQIQNISPPSNFEDIISSAKQTEIVQKKSRNPIRQINQPSTILASKSTSTLNKSKLMALNSSPKRDQHNAYSTMINTTRPYQQASGKQPITVKMTLSGQEISQL